MEGITITTQLIFKYDRGELRGDPGVCGDGGAACVLDPLER